jgi:hypothetical protein
MLDDVLALFASSLNDVEKALKDVPDARLAEQPAGVANHPAWTVGHLVVSANYVAHLLGEPRAAVPEPYPAMFRPGTTPRPDRSVYPSKDQLLAHLRAAHAAAESAARRSYAARAGDASPEDLRSFSPTVGRIVVFLLAAHEPYHVGQLMVWRRAAGVTEARSTGT